MLIQVGQNEYGFPDFRFLPKYEIIDGFTIKPGEVLGRTKPGALFEHRALVSFNGAVFHSPAPGDVFRPGSLQEVLAPGGRIRIVYPSNSWEETARRIARAEQILGMPWWNMNCHQTTDFVVGIRNLFLT